MSPYVSMIFREWVRSEMPVHCNDYWTCWKQRGGVNPLSGMEYLADDIDLVLHFENLHNDLEKLSRITSLDFATLGHHRKSSSGDYRNSYDDETKLIVHNMFGEEDKFEYIF